MKSRNGPNHALSLREIMRLVTCAVVFIIVSGGSARGITTYSGASVSSNGTINGWGVTDAYVSGMHHTAYISTTLSSPKSRTSSSGWRYATTTVRADVSLPWDGTDMGTYTETSQHKYYCYAVMYMIILSGTLAAKDVVPPALDCESKTRGQSATCTVTDVLAIWNVSNWQYRDGVTGAITVSDPSRTAKNWLGVVVRSGTVSVQASGPDNRSLSKPLSVITRSGWAFTAVSPGKVGNGAGTGGCTGQLPLLASPPVPGSEMGHSCLFTGDLNYVTYTVPGGPNSQYKYNSSNASNSALYQWERVPDLDNSSSAFYTHQTGTYNAQTNPSGCISGVNLAAQTQRHETGSVQGHWGFYKNAQDNPSNNFGTIIEAKVGLPSQSTDQFQSELNSDLNTAKTTIGNSFAVEPYGVDHDQNNVFLGWPNYPPTYNNCQ